MDRAASNAESSLLDALLDGLLDAVVVINSHGTIVRASSSVESHFGWRPAELEGQNVKVLVPEPHRTNHDGYLERYRKTGKTWILGTAREFEVVRKDGSHIPCELSVSKIDGTDAREALYCGSFRDITERTRARQALRRSEEKFRAVFEHENQIVLLLDPSGLVTEANAPALARIGMNPAAVVGKALHEAPFWSSLPGNRDAVVRALDAANQDGLGITRADVCIPDDLDNGFTPGAKVELGHQAGGCAGGRPFAHEVSIRVLPSDSEGAPAAIVEVRDITALVESERRESAVIRSLARVGEESAVLAHELRSPVSSLELALKAVGRQLGTEENSMLIELAERMRRLEELLNRTLRFSRPLELRLQEVNVSDALGRALEHEAVAIRQGSCRASVSIQPGTPPILADPAALTDLLSNLVRNAIEAQPEGGRVALSAAPSPDQPGVVTIAVGDDGPGIPPAERESAFRLFRTGKEDGTGLGLPLVRKIAEEHGARVRMTDGEHGQGLLVVLDWPTATPPTTSPG